MDKRECKYINIDIIARYSHFTFVLTKKINKMIFILYNYGDSIGEKNTYFKMLRNLNYYNIETNQ